MINDLFKKPRIYKATRAKVHVSATSFKCQSGDTNVVDYTTWAYEQFLYHFTGSSHTFIYTTFINEIVSPTFDVNLRYPTNYEGQENIFCDLISTQWTFKSYSFSKMEPPRSCDLIPYDFVIGVMFVNKPQNIREFTEEIRRVIDEI